MTENKKQYREQQIKRLSEFSQTDEAQNEAKVLYNKLFTSEEFIKAKTIGVTVSMGFEMDTKPIIEQCLKLGKLVYVPKTDNIDKSMSFIQFTDYNNLVETEFGVSEPVKDEPSLNPPDLVIVPGLAYSADNYRLGFGAGFYDRYLKKYRPQTISLAYSQQLVKNSPWEVETHDISVDKIISVK